MQGRIKQLNSHINWITKEYRNSNPRITKNEWFETKNKTQLGHWKKVMKNKEVDKPIHPRDKEQNLNIKQFHNLKRNMNSKTQNPGSTTSLCTSGLMGCNSTIKLSEEIHWQWTWSQVIWLRRKSVASREEITVSWNPLDWEVEKGLVLAAMGRATNRGWVSVVLYAEVSVELAPSQLCF